MTSTSTDIDLVMRSPTMATAGKAIRDPRLDFFRGFAMFMILVAHTPGNAWTLWIFPARWGFSDATEIFVFCSGMASAIAFGRTFDRAGWLLGAARVAYRVWQIYWAHICLFVAIVTIMAAIDASGWYPDRDYIGSLNLWKFFIDPAPQLIGLMTLTYVPNYFDVLPMYMAVLAMMPFVMALSRVSLPLLGAVLIGVWLLAQEALLSWLGLSALHLSLPAEPWSDRQWFFNPFGWQLVFFTGFALMRGWIPAPPVTPWLVALTLAVVVLSAVHSNVGARAFGFAIEWRQANGAWFDKSDFAILRYVDFLSLAYLAWAAAGERGHRLIATGQGVAARLWDETVQIVMTVGQQSLAVFVFSMALARVNGYILDVIGRNAMTWTLVNLTGFGLLVACAFCVGWFKSQPWRAQR
ncbi:OpgC family protein [Jannaschia rubra]|uniref:OpgC protein n=1 Tax=Jannaschia rubra TaxID=282197 RepID=A0A0M6XVQ0_9RHOB|nr:OpgC domain-containing protein [Jannaschia rubra]CTQ34361.1 OpgC protein [Jannaschia rubra]SFG62901.1 hypothetical protein SAMN04488517_10875 [Jannaschia rubra]